ncbi:MAG: 3-phosphoshikimate 1-carboxyvinyltransferase [Acutalibacteraceae bacterium]
MTVEMIRSKAKGCISAPPSKSMAHRCLICAGLAKGESRISHISYSQDILATLDCLQEMGATFEKGDDFVIIKGASPKAASGKVYPCRESGSTLRFFLPLLLLSDGEKIMTGYGRLMERPLSVYEKICRENGIVLERGEGFIRLGTGLRGGVYEVAGNISSQFITGLLLALSLCEEKSELTIIPPIESRSYIDMTLQAMEKFSVKLQWQGNTLSIPGNSEYCARDITVEGDYSNAAFLEAFNLLGGEVIVSGLDEDSLQGDKIYRDYFSQIASGSPTLDVGNCPDLAPILMTAMAFCHGGRLMNTARLKIKESDRGEVMARELRKFGGRIAVNENDIIVEDRPLHQPQEILESHNDHRIAMSLAVLGSAYGGRIRGAEAVQKSYPDFFEKIGNLGVEVKQYDD